MNDEEFVDYLINAGEAVEYGEPWTERTTYEWWRDRDGKRHARLVMTYHGGGCRGDDDEAEYVQRLLNTSRAVVAREVPSGVDQISQYPPNITHVIVGGKPRRFRYYVAPPEGVSE